VAQGAQALSAPILQEGHCYWLEGRSTEGGRNTLMCHGMDGQTRELTPLPFNVRSRVHEYGGGAYAVAGDTLLFADFRDNQWYQQHADGAAHPITDGDPQFRYADPTPDLPRQRVIMVCEDHHSSDLQPENTLCALALDGASTRTVLARGHDFYAAPRLSPDGRHLTWLCWDHPRMPWQGSELWLAAVQADGSLGPAQKIAGGEEEAVCQPCWSPDGTLYFVSDRSGWWNIYRWQDGQATCVHTRAAEFGAPHWMFANAMLGFVDASTLVCQYLEQGISHLARIDTASGQLQEIELDYTDISALAVDAHGVLMIAGAPHRAAEVVHLHWQADGSTRSQVLASSIRELPDASWLSQATSISYPSNGRTAHAFYYAPCNPECQAAPGSLPPLIVIGHGGPTSMAGNSLRLMLQFWTSRGFAVLDVNYGGSSGFGRAYRDALRGQWGVVDTDDCVNGARYLVAQKWVDGNRLIIRGGSAGGFTTLCALMFHDVFKVGGCYYGVSNLAALDSDSHKFESHYNQYLIAPPPHNQALYAERSPSNHLERLRCPMIFFQGQDDKVVPPSQSEQMVDALRERNIAVEYLLFPGEGHGFRKAENLERSLEAERDFYCRILGLGLADSVPSSQ
jgi:dipeptidyl aminopeptidase/acylaminoacyl peptidase